MYRFAIFYLLTTFYVSFAPAEVTREEVCKLEEAKIDFLQGGEEPKTFNKGDVYLYKIIDHYSAAVQMYVIEDSDKISEQFAILQCNTIVLENKITIKRQNQLITLIVANTVAVYGKFFTLDGLSDQFYVTRFFEVRKVWKNVTIKVKKVDFGQWLLVAVENNTNKPCVLFTTSTFEFPKQKQSNEEMTLVLQTKPETLISMEFNNSTNIDRFYSLLRCPLKFKLNKK